METTLNADCRPELNHCPRCGEHGLEKLSTHTFCVNCDYHQIHMTFDESIMKSYNQAVKMEKQLDEVISKKQCPIVKIKKQQKIKKLVG